MCNCACSQIHATKLQYARLVFYPDHIIHILKRKYSSYMFVDYIATRQTFFLSPSNVFLSHVSNRWAELLWKLFLWRFHVASDLHSRETANSGQLHFSILWLMHTVGGAFMWSRSLPKNDNIHHYDTRSQFGHFNLATLLWHTKYHMTSSAWGFLFMKLSPSLS